MGIANREEHHYAIPAFNCTSLDHTAVSRASKVVRVVDELRH